LKDGMLPADSQVINDDIVVGTPTQGRAILGQLNFLDDNTVDRYDHFRHGRLLFLLLVFGNLLHQLFSQQSGD